MSTRRRQGRLFPLTFKAKKAKKAHNERTKRPEKLARRRAKTVTDDAQS